MTIQLRDYQAQAIDITMKELILLMEAKEERRRELKRARKLRKKKKRRIAKALAKVEVVG